MTIDNGLDMLCAENHRQSPGRHFIGPQTERGRGENREQHGEEQLRAR